MKNRKILWVLGFLLAGVWGTITYQVVDVVSSNDKIDTAGEGHPMPSRSSRLAVPYRNDVKDPFEYFKPQERKRTKKAFPLAIPQLFIPPPFRLTGIVLDDKKRTAVLEARDGSVSFVSEGDTVGSVRILNIEKKTVTYYYMKKKNTWNLND